MTARRVEPRPGGAINHHDVVVAMYAAGYRGPVVWPGGKLSWYRGTGDNQVQWRRWADVDDAFPTVKRWATLGGTGGAPWLALDGAADALSTVAMAGTRRRPRLVEGRPCEVLVHHGFSITVCGRPIDPTATTVVKAIGVDDGAGCKMHVAAQARSDASMAAHRARWDARDEREQRRREVIEASRSWAERLREELGVAAEATDHGADEGHLRVAVDPERLYGQLVDLVAELRDFDIPHPFHPDVEVDR